MVATTTEMLRPLRLKPCQHSDRTSAELTATSSIQLTDSEPEEILALLRSSQVPGAQSHTVALNYRAKLFVNALLAGIPAGKGVGETKRVSGDHNSVVSLTLECTPTQACVFWVLSHNCLNVIQMASLEYHLP